MRDFLNRSFRTKLLVSFLLIGMVPLLLCTVLMLGIFQSSLHRSVADTAQTQLDALCGELDGLLDACAQVMDRLRSSGRVRSALDSGHTDMAQDIYSILYDTASPLLNDAAFSLFDAGGSRLYATASLSGGGCLSVDWGLLKAARRSPDIVYRDVDDFGQGGAGSLLQAACAVREGERVVGYVVLDLTQRHFERLFEKRTGSAGGVLVLDAFWDEVYASASLRDAGLAPVLRERLLAGLALDGGGEYSYYVRPGGAGGLCLILQQPKPLAGWVMRLLYLVAGVAILLCLGLCAAVSMGMSRQLFAPIRALNSAMEEVERGNLDARVEPRGADEMAQLAGRFNRMTRRLEENLEQSLRQQRELNDAQIRMMQAQLNPHFLYNTLDTVKWLGKIHQVPEVATISADLADILRSSITNDEFVPLEQELRLLDRYVEIQRIRFSGTFQLRTQVDDGLLDVLVPKLMLQPLVENAIIHGFEDSDGGEIVVSAREEPGYLLITVSDDGRGMSEESLRNFQAQILPGPGRHLGLHNVDAILRLHYGPDNGLRFVPTGGRGTCVRITLPITRREVPSC